MRLIFVKESNLLPRNQMFNRWSVRSSEGVILLPGLVVLNLEDQLVPAQGEAVDLGYDYRLDERIAPHAVLSGAYRNGQVVTAYLHVSMQCDVRVGDPILTGTVHGVTFRSREVPTVAAPEPVQRKNQKLGGRGRKKQRST